MAIVPSSEGGQDSGVCFPTLFLEEQLDGTGLALLTEALSSVLGHMPLVVGLAQKTQCLLL